MEQTHVLFLAGTYLPFDDSIILNQVPKKLQIALRVKIKSADYDIWRNHTYVFENIEIGRLSLDD